MTIKDFLNNNSLGEYVKAFENQAIDMETLMELSDQELKQDLHMKLGHIKKLRKLLLEWNEESHHSSNEKLSNMIQTFPSIVSAPLISFLEESNPKLKLWDICDFTELLLRFIVIIGLAEIREKNEQLSEQIIEEIKFRIEQPTLGKWLGMAIAISRYPSVDDGLKGLLNKVKPLIEGPANQSSNERSSLLKLRNHLAHGGSISIGMAEHIFQNWKNTFEEMVLSLEWLAKCELIAKEGQGYRVLKGDFTTITSCTKPKKELDLYFKDDQAVVLHMSGKYLLLWPLIFYHSSAITNTRPRQNIFVRRGELFLEYTPVGSTDVCQTESDRAALDTFVKLFKLESKNKREQESKFLVRDFTSEILQDAKRFIGRVKERQYIIHCLRNVKEHVYWITGNAGIGKSYLMASTLMDLMDSATENDLILPYRFKAGDDRCYRNEFITYLIERINEWAGIPITITKQPSTYKVEDLHLLLSNVEFGNQVYIIVDGLDELPERDQMIAEEICQDLKYDNVKWLCSGRTNPKLNRIFHPNKCLWLFKDGVPPMQKEDIQGMIYEKIGPLRRKLIKHEFEVDQEMINPFLEQVWRYSKGIPLYVTYLIGDILSGRIKTFDGETDKLPPSIYDYHKELVNRCSIGLYQQILPRLISTVAISKEALTQESLLDILIRENILPNNEQARGILHNSLTFVAPMLRRVSSLYEEEDGYILYHSSLLDYLNENQETNLLLQTARDGLIRLVKSSIEIPTLADQYLLRWGIRHLLDEKQIQTLLVSELLSSVSYLHLKLQYQKLENFIDDLYDGYNIVIQQGKDSPNILIAFIQLILDQELKPNPVLNIETIHALFVYREDESFYKDFLTYSIHYADSDMSNHPSYKKLLPSLLSRLANFNRRKGNLVEATQLLEKSIPTFEKEHNDRELQRVEYDLAYIQYLLGKPEKAYSHFEKSKNHAKRINDTVGYWMSHCVQSHTALFDSTRKHTIENFIQDCQEALPIFKLHAIRDGNENAKRWIKNIYAHLVKAAFELKNLELAEENYEKLLQDEWVKKFKGGRMPDYEVRILLLRGEQTRALEVFQEYLDEASLSQESLAKEYLEYASLLFSLGYKKEAKEKVEIGLSQPENFGNSYYRRGLLALLADIKNKEK
jgi:hypothetical protein